MNQNLANKQNKYIVFKNPDPKYFGRFKCIYNYNDLTFIGVGDSQMQAVKACKKTKIRYKKEDN